MTSISAKHFMILPYQTQNRNTVLINTSLRRPAGNIVGLNMSLAFDDNGNCVITKAPTGAATLSVTGTGKFVSNGGTWGGKPRNAIIMNYQVTDAANNETHQANDTLLIRDRDVRLETFTPVIN
jgi:hypothetical protein